MPGVCPNCGGGRLVGKAPTALTEQGFPDPGDDEREPCPVCVHPCTEHGRLFCYECLCDNPETTP